MTREEAEKIVFALDRLNRGWIWDLLRRRGEYPDRTWEAWAEMLREAADALEAER